MQLNYLFYFIVYSPFPEWKLSKGRIYTVLLIALSLLFFPYCSELHQTQSRNYILCLVNQ